jgi:Nif-specific regulatory protein
VVEIEVPPLRERGHVDLDRLVDHFLYELSRRHKRPGLVLTPEARAAMHAWDWPGNVRELEHAVEAAVVLARGNAITADLLPFRKTARAPSEPVPADGSFVTPPRSLREVELAYIRHVLALCGDNRTAAAKMLGIGRNTLVRKLRELS